MAVRCVHPNLEMMQAILIVLLVIFVPITVLKLTSYRFREGKEE